MLRKIKKIYNKKFSPNYAKMIYKNRMYLKSGKYSISDNGKILYLNNSEDLMNNILKNTFDIKKNNSFHLNKKQNYYFNLYKNNSIFLGDMMLFSTSNSEKKFFDFKEKKILTKFLNRKQFTKRIKNMLYFNKYFSLPNIYYIDYKKKYYIEQIIEKSIDSFDYLENLYNEYLDYFDCCYKNNQYKYIYIENLKKQIKDKYLIQEITNIVEDKKILKLPVIKMHGDLWKSNILISENKHYLIDWEWTDLYSIYYDYFTFILNEATLNNNKQFLISYFYGKYDKKMEECGKKVGYSYLKEYRREYFIIFLCEVSIVRWKGEFSKVCPDIIELMEEINIY